ncbi:MAG TPA: DPP IV N-terminal domain-containing protein [Bryobacteraceae bacterium]|nr:DPP IV N-terminal domain-containing protein [Bryobacteraceae bacterium]
MTARLLLFLCAISMAVFAQESERITNRKQLTSGGQNAEAYWSPSGKRLVFQSTRDGAQCDQIYVMDADGQNVKRISNGTGATTCGYFLPDEKHVLYASTHEGGAACPPRPDRSKGYMWAVPATYDIYTATLDGKIIRKLTNEAGYDAEATVNWARKNIVYTSKGSGDLDLWSMNMDGGGKKRLTSSRGYDGGAFYSRDGKKIVWRAHHPAPGDGMERYNELLARDVTAPMKMELFVANADGSGSKQITNFGCASFAPQFTPDGKRIIFASNKNNCDSRNFELFLLDVDGSNVEQVTRFGGFTSFPDFSPDGKRIVFTSSYGAKSPYEFNIFVADWK